MEYNSDNVFAKILRGEIETNKIYEDDYAIAFYDIAPKAKVHALVISKAMVVDFEDFIELLHEKGYETKQGKHFAVKPPGMSKFRRCKTLGEDYSEESIRRRIAEEDLSFYQSQKEFKPEIVKCYVRRYKRARLTGLQKRYYAKLYRIGKLKKKPYSQAWKYKNDIKKMEKLQQQYLFPTAV